MTRVKYTGVTRKGTLRPRRMWPPGEVLEVDNEIASELIKSPDFRWVRTRKRKIKPEEKPEKKLEEEPEKKESEE